MNYLSKDIFYNNLLKELTDITDHFFKNLFTSPHHNYEDPIQKIFNGNLEPGIGALIYCELLTAEHSGIYLGNHEIAHLNSKGKIEIVSPAKFTNSIYTSDTDIFIPMIAKNTPAHYTYAAKFAKNQIGKKRNYNVLLDNCHQFSAGCIVGNLENMYNFLALSKLLFQIEIGHKIYWQRWDWKKKPTWVKIKHI